MVDAKLARGKQKIPVMTGQRSRRLLVSQMLEFGRSWWMCLLCGCTATRFGLLMRTGSGGGSSTVAMLLTPASLIHGDTQLSLDQLSFATRTLFHRAPNRLAKSLRLVQHLSQTRNRTESTLIWRLRPRARPNALRRKTPTTRGYVVVKTKHPSPTPTTLRNKLSPATAIRESAVMKLQLDSGNNHARNINKINYCR